MMSRLWALPDWTGMDKKTALQITKKLNTLAANAPWADVYFHSYRRLLGLEGHDTVEEHAECEQAIDRIVLLEVKAGK